jgi:hypothetical protein
MRQNIGSLRKINKINKPLTNEIKGRERRVSKFTELELNGT